MLRLKRLELQGFKSFADRTELRFDGTGIVAIVGPNGCGKSNLADAFSWVLGEQSARSLRGARMEDVIFAGTRERKPVSLAQVTITLAEPLLDSDEAAPQAGCNGKPANGKAGAGPREITITRRLFRSGESEYLIDGRPARLRDIQDIFLGTGLGPDAYGIIEQGRIGQILSSKPQDRRLLIEEAAGISRFKTRRRLAEAKLEGAKHNLERVFDILEEVGRQVNSLKRQAAKARRWEELRAQMRAQLEQVLAARYRMLEREAARLAVELNLASGQVQALAARVSAGEAAQAAAERRAHELEVELRRVRQRVADLSLEQERVRGRLESQARQAASVEQRLNEGLTELGQVESTLEGLAAEQATQQLALAELDKQAGCLRDLLQEKTAEREQLERKLEERERGMDSARQGLLGLLGEIAAVRNQLAQLEECLAALERDGARASREEQAAGSDLAWLEQCGKELREKEAAQKQELELASAERSRVESLLAQARRERAEAQRRQERLRAEYADLRARRDSLEQILSHRAYTAESVKRLFTAVAQGQVQGFVPLGVLADFLEVEAGWERAVEEFLHEELEYVVVESWSQAERGLELLRAGGEGRATFLLRWAEQMGSFEIAGPAPQPGLVGPLREAVRVSDGLGEGLVDRLARLRCCWLATDAEVARRLAQAYPHLFFLLPDGVCYHGCALSGGRKSGSGPLALKRELRELRVAVQDKERQLEQVAERLGQLDGQIAGMESELDKLRARQQQVEKEVLALEHERRKLAEEAQKAASRLSIAQLERERLAREKAQALEQRERCRLAVEEKERRREEQERALAEARGQMERLRAELTRCTEEHSSLRVELAGVEERRRAQSETVRQLQSRVRELEGRKQRLKLELEKLKQERERLGAEDSALRERLSALAGEVSEAAEQAERVGAECDHWRQELAREGEQLRQLRAELEAARERRAQIEVELVKQQADLRFLDETSRKELGVPAEQLSAGEETALDSEALAAVEQKYQELKERMEALGPVNPQALEEYQQAQQRYDFLNVQRQDLLDSIRDTEQAIREIDAETRKRFQEAFEAINGHFQGMFRSLFGGGTAEMRLTDPENLAESGIDVVASPPGKQLQNVLLLSGGEKALTALALLLAIFKFQPSPFCVLDEVDAPLDDPNIDRLMRVLAEMSRQTQFIIITHTKRTMEAAHALYGVTMQEPGVSKLVSVRFQSPVAAASAPVLELAARA